METASAGESVERATGRIYRFAYFGSPTDHAMPKEGHLPAVVGLHELRDGDAFVELAPLLFRPHAIDGARYTYGGLVLNYPAPKNHDTRRDRLFGVDASFLTPSDLLVLTTRPPLDDSPSYDRKVVRRSYTTLEAKVLESLQPYFVRCTRSFVELSDSLKTALRAAHRGNRGQVEYKVNAPAVGSYKARHDSGPGRSRWDEGDETRTGVYFVYKKPAWPDGPALLTAFGMSGPLTLLWAHMLGTRGDFASVLTRPRFLMAEIEFHPLPPRIQDLAFADQWSVEVVLDCPLD
jgi:hypothetical protein